jgi:hypothetical protein
MLNNGKFDWVLIDGEHGLISDKDYYDVSRKPDHFQLRPSLRLDSSMSLLRLLARPLSFVSPVVRNGSSRELLIRELTAS